MKGVLASQAALNPRGERVSDFSARTYVVPTSLNSRSDGQHATPDNTYPYEPYGPEKWLQRRNSQMAQIRTGLSVNIICHGNTYVNAGQKVILNLPYTAALKAVLYKYKKRYRTYEARTVSIRST